MKLGNGDDRLDEGETGYVVDVPLRFDGDPTNLDEAELGDEVAIGSYDPSDDSYMARLVKGGGSSWVDARYISRTPPYEPVTETELDEVYKIFGVDRE